MTNEEAIKWMEEAIVDTKEFFDQCSPALQKELIEQKEVFELAISAIRAAPKHLDREAWVSVDDKLPQDEKEVLAYYGFNHGDGDLGMRFMGTLTYFAHDPEPHWQHKSTGITVTHWMPLPEPPEKLESAEPERMEMK